MSSSSDCSSDTDSEECTTSFITLDAESNLLPAASNDGDVGVSDIVRQSNSKIHEIVDLDTMEKAVGYGEHSSTDQCDSTDGTVVMRHRPSESRSHSSPFRKQARLSKMLQEDDSSSDDELYTIGTIPATSAVKQPAQAILQPTTTGFSTKRTGDISAGSIESSNTAAKTDTEQETVPMQLLSKVVNPEVLSRVKSHLKAVVTTRKSSPITTISCEASPAKLWEMRKKMQNDKVLLNKTQASKLKAGWKVRQCLASLPDGENVNTLYLTLVRRGMHREVDALFKMAKVTKSDPFDEFDKNYYDSDWKSALTIATDMKDESMIRKLIEHKVNLGLSIFHVIEADFMEGLKLILACNPCINLKIVTENYYFKIGMTPMLMAAHKNNYRMLSLLYDYGHRLTEMKDWIEGIQVAWESSNERRMICLARAQPAYITLKTEVNRMNPMKYCLKEIKRLRRCATEEHEFSAFYKEIKSKYEEYMCSLLDFVCSSEELSDLFQLDIPEPHVKKKEQIGTYIDGAKSKRWKHLSSFEVLERASRENLVQFVTHQQSQLALSYMRYRSLPLLRSNPIAYATGLLFPFLSLFYVCAPNTPLGGLITLPVVSFYCHMMSDFVFALLLLLKILVRDVKFDRLGEPVTVLEWVIFTWILGKWVQEFQECINRGWKAYIRDIWNYTDIILLTLFSTSMAIRLHDAAFNANLEHVSRYEWDSFEPRLIGEGMQAFGYVFLFLRLLGLTRADRYLGPLQISLGKMLADVVRFLCLFALVLGAFAFGLSDLYWYYGTTEGSKVFCDTNSTFNLEENATKRCTERDVAFTSIVDSMVDLFWALFGLFDLEKMSLGGKHAYTEYIGRSLVAIYHVVAIIVMLNMLIAMMSKTYEDTSENEEIAWKFHRTSVWIRFIRREVVRPPPMNLFPNPWRFRENIRSLQSFVQRCCRGGNLTNDAYNEQGRRIPHSRKKPRRLRLWCGKSGSKDGIKESTVETDNILTPSHKATQPEPIPMLNSVSRQHHHTHNPRFNPAVVSGVRAALRINVRQQHSKAVLTKLVFRYKIKHLTKK